MSGLDASRQAYRNIPHNGKDVVNPWPAPPIYCHIEDGLGLKLYHITGFASSSSTSSHSRSRQNSWMAEAVEDSWRPVTRTTCWSGQAALVCGFGGQYKSMILYTFRHRMMIPADWVETSKQHKGFVDSKLNVITLQLATCHGESCLAAQQVSFKGKVFGGRAARE